MDKIYKTNIYRRNNEYKIIKYNGGEKMAKSSRKVADCRMFPSEKGCTLTISGTEDEVMKVAVRHAVEEHGHKDTSQLRKDVRSLLKTE